jgi:DNA repair exonuclease SbcCD ATPase subunit
VRNRVFAEVFDGAWIRARETRREFGDALTRWLAAPPDDRDRHLLRGGALDGALTWAFGRRDLTPDEELFLRLSAEAQAREARERATLRTRAAWWLGVATALAVALAGTGFALWRASRAKEAVAVEAARKTEGWAEAQRASRAAREAHERQLAALAASLRTRTEACEQLETRLEALQQATAAVARTEAAAQSAEARSDAATAAIKSHEELTREVRASAESRLALQGALDGAREELERQRIRLRDLERTLAGARDHAVFLEGQVDDRQAKLEERDATIADLEDRLLDVRDEARRPAALARIRWSGAKVRYDSLGDAAAALARVMPDVRSCAVRTTLDCPAGTPGCAPRALVECEGR